ncbi:MAG: hypothetical protein ACREOE_08780, partial [Gemmatimonadales bacterium]
VIELTRDFLNDLADLVARARAARGDGDEARREAILSAYLDVLIAHHRVIDLLSRNPATQNHPDVGLRARNLIEALTAELAGPDSTADDKLRVACAIGAVNSVAMTPAADAAKARAVVIGAALAALGAQRHAPARGPRRHSAG